MNEAVLRFNNITVYGFGVLAVLAFLWGTFVYFRKASESHHDERQILDSVVLAGFWGFIVGRLVFAIFNLNVFWTHWSRLLILANYPGLSRWGVILGMVWGIWLACRKVKIKLIDWLDFLAVGISAGTAIFFAGFALISLMWQYAVLAVLFLLSFIYFWGVDYRYRTFAWYRYNKTSARSGFITGFSLSVWGVLFLLENILISEIFWERVFLSVVLFVGGLILVYIRSGRTVKEDLKIIFKNGKK